MNPDVRHRYEHYQLLMSFLDQELPANGWSVMKKGDLGASEDSEEYYDRYLDGDKRENFVRRFLNLPTVQQDRKKADELLKEIQEKANRK